jgi:hypothetical protein
MSQVAHRRRTRNSTKETDVLIALIQTLARDYDHVFLDVEGAEHFGAPFGLSPHTRVEQATPDQPKGLTLHGGEKSARGIAADDLAGQIARHLGVTFEDKFGRGSRLRSACSAIEAHLKALKKAGEKIPYAGKVAGQRSMSQHRRKLLDDLKE